MATPESSYLPRPLWFYLAGELLFLGYHVATATGVRLFASVQGPGASFWATLPIGRDPGAITWVHGIAVTLVLILLARRSFAFPPVALLYSLGFVMYGAFQALHLGELLHAYPGSVGPTIYVLPVSRILWPVIWIGYGMASRRLRSPFGWVLAEE